MTKFQKLRELYIMWLALVTKIPNNLLSYKNELLCHNNFTTNFRWHVIINSNLDLQLKLLFYPPITAYYIILLCSSVDIYRYN